MNNQHCRLADGKIKINTLTLRPVVLIYANCERLQKGMIKVSSVHVQTKFFTLRNSPLLEQNVLEKVQIAEVVSAPTRCSHTHVYIYIYIQTMNDRKKGMIVSVVCATQI